jgi:hypothetical protein
LDLILLAGFVFFIAASPAEQPCISECDWLDQPPMALVLKIDGALEGAGCFALNSEGKSKPS